MTDAMTDPIIAAARDHAEDRRDVLVSIAESLSPDQLANAAIDAAVLAREDARRAAEERDEIKRALAESTEAQRKTLAAMADYTKVTEERIAGLTKDRAAQARKLDEAVASMGKLRSVRDVARDEADRLAARLDDAKESAETQRRAACNLRDALDRVATAAGVADGSGDEVADRIVEAIGRLRESVARLTKPDAQPVAAVEPMTEADRQRRLRAEWNGKPAPSKPEPQPVATVGPAPTQADRYVVATRDKIPPGTPAVWLGLHDPSERVAAMVAANPGRFAWTVEAPPWATGAIIDTAPGTPGGPVDVDAAELGRVYAAGWTDAGPMSATMAWAAVICRLAELHPDVPAGWLRVAVGVAPTPNQTTASTPPAKPAPRYAPSPIDHLIQAWGPLADSRYVAVPADAAKDVPQERVLWRYAERHATFAADALNRGACRRDYVWGPDSTPESRSWAVVDRGEPIGEEG